MNTPTQNTEHTLGPWRAHGNLIYGTHKGRQEFLVAKVCVQSEPELEKANAALIACAPALLVDNQRLQSTVETIAAENRELQDVAAKHRADNQRLREQLAQLTEALRTMVEQAGCYMDDGEATSEEIEAMAKARSALSVVERGNK